MRLENKVALVTGGNRGIGEAMVRLFASEGAKVVAASRSAELGEAVAAELREQGHDVTFISADVSDEDTVAALIAKTVELYGKLDIVVNNAGIAPASPIETMEASAWDDLMRCNVRSMFLVSKHAIPELRKTRGAIINLGSTFGVVGAGGSAGYAVTKAAAVNFS